MLKDIIKQLGLGLIIALVLVILQIGLAVGMIILSIIVAAREIYHLAFLQKSSVDWVRVGMTELGGVIIYLLSTFI